MSTVFPAVSPLTRSTTELRFDRIIDARVATVSADSLLAQCLARQLMNVGADVVGSYARATEVPLSVLSDPLVLALDPLTVPRSSAFELVERHRSVGVLIMRAPEGESGPNHERIVSEAEELHTIIDGVQALWGKVRPDLRDRRHKHPLTVRQLQLLQMVADGLTTNEIAVQVGVTSKTVNNHLGAVYRRLDTRNLTQAVLRAARMGLVRLP